mmetsp:Transcript_128430/g.256532  ORF Transcript_128430/g.256532 Transcript_128430/m.256532 type:complete len:90 (+) Transcript_128430:533-802(+)
MPVLDATGRCVGLIDAESWTPDFFDDNRVAIVARCALDVADELVVEQQPSVGGRYSQWTRLGAIAVAFVVASMLLQTFLQQRGIRLVTP